MKLKLKLKFIKVELKSIKSNNSLFFKCKQYYVQNQIKVLLRQYIVWKQSLTKYVTDNLVYRVSYQSLYCHS